MKAAILKALVTVMIVAASFLESCTPDDRAFVRGLAEEWMREHNVNPTEKDGSINVGGIINIGAQLLGVRDRDPEVEAVMNAYTVIDNINQSDQLMEEGRRDRDPAKMDQAINNRPGDWTYRTSRGALALEQGDVDTAQQQFAAADAIIQDRNIDPTWYANQGISDLQSVPGAEHYNYGPICRTYYEQLSYYQAVLHEAATDPQVKARAMAAWQAAQAKLNQCK